MLFHLGIVLSGVRAGDARVRGRMYADPNDNWCTNAVPGDSEVMPVVEVELDIFSGMPNPTWMLGNDEAESFTARLAALPRMPAMKLASNLGYRGFVVRLTDRTTVQSIRIQRSVVEVSKDSAIFYTRDQDRALERWLLNTGKPHMEDDIFKLAEREMR